MITGMPSGRRFPLAFGIYTRRTGDGSHEERVRCTRTATCALASGVSATSPVDPGGLAPGIALRHLPHATY